VYIISLAGFNVIWCDFGQFC